MDEATPTWTPSLLIAEGGRLSVMPLDREEWLVGRGEDCQLRLLDPQVSRRHALLYREGTGLFLRDLGGKNPILRNDRPIVQETLELFPGDRLLLGETLLVYQGRAPVLQAGDEETVEAPSGNDPWPRAGEAALQLLGRLTGCLAGPTDEREAAAHFLDLLLELLPSRLGLVVDFDAQDGLLAVHGPDGQDLSFPPALRDRLEGTRAAACLRGLETDGAESDPGNTLPPEDGIFVAPLVVNGKLFGAVYLERSWPASAGDRDRDLETLRHASRLLSHCLHRQRRLHQLEERTKRLDLPGASSWIQDRRRRPPRLASLSEVEREHIRYVLHALNGHRENCARILGIATSTLYEKMRRHGIKS